MKMLISQEEFDKKTSRELIPLECKFCNKSFNVVKCGVNMGIKKTSGHTREFCSLECFGRYKTDRDTKIINCKHCNNEIRKYNRDIKLGKNCFCSSSCSTTYNNTHKTKGYRRSKLEVWLESKLLVLYPTLEMSFNKTDAINSELDIYIPSLQLAFELNGIFHYEPIYGKEKLAQILNNDRRKFQACLEKGIELCIIDVSTFSYFKEIGAQKYLTIIEEVINRKVGAGEGNRTLVI